MDNYYDDGYHDGWEDELPFWSALFLFVQAGVLVALWWCCCRCHSSKATPQRRRGEEDDEDETNEVFGPRAIVTCLFTKTVPKARVEGCMVLNEDTNTLVLYGGLGEDDHESDSCTLALDAGEENWTLTSMLMDRGRSGHCMVWFRNVIFVYGGLVGNDLDHRVYFLRDDQLEPVAFIPRNNYPCARAFASLNAWRDCLILYGGHNHNFALDDVWRLDVVDNTKLLRWTEIKTPKSPPGRSQHAAVVVEDCLLIFGGASNDVLSEGPSRRLEKLDALNLVTTEWIVLETSGKSPKSLPGMLAHRIGIDDDLVCVVANEESGNGVFNDIYILHCDMRGVNSQPTWIKLHIDWDSDWTMIPGRQEGHFSTGSPASGTLFVFGGRTPRSNTMSDATLIVDLAEAAGLHVDSPEDVVDEPPPFTKTTSTTRRTTGSRVTTSTLCPATAARQPMRQRRLT